MDGSITRAVKVMSDIVNERLDREMTTEQLSELFKERWYAQQEREYRGKSKVPPIVHQVLYVLKKKKKICSVGRGIYVRTIKNNDKDAAIYYGYPDRGKKDPFLSGKAYITPKICSRKHFYRETGMSLRYKKGNGCVECLKEKAKIFYKDYK